MKRALIAVGAIAFTFAAAPGFTGRAAAQGLQNGAAGGGMSSLMGRNQPPMGSGNGQLFIAVPGNGSNRRSGINPPSNAPSMGPLMAVMGPQILQAEMADPQIRGAIMEIHGRMLEDVGKLLMRCGQQMQEKAGRHAASMRSMPNEEGHNSNRNYQAMASEGGQFNHNNSEGRYGGGNASMSRNNGGNQ